MKEVKENKKNSKPNKRTNKKIAVKVESEQIEEEFNETDEIDLEELGREVGVDLKTKKRKKKRDNGDNKKKFLIIFILVIFFIVLLYFLLLPRLTLNGSNKIEISYDVEYMEEGAKARFLGKDVSKNVKIIGKVDSSKVGTYTLTYQIKKALFKVSKKRVVNVVDKNPPVIVLEGDEEVSICPNSEFEELGFTATDEYDGLLTDNVKREENNDSIVYSVSDSSNNLYTVTRKLNREDSEAPKISLNGNSTMYVTVNNKFTEPGYTVTDNCSSSLEDKVKVSGSVDTSKTGTYELKYTVSDEAGNEASATRKVVVQTQVVKRSASLTCGEAGVIYLTFDDGPNNSTTTTILNVLKKYDVKATFFVTNTNGGSDSQIKREFDEGHLVALHTNTHTYSKVYASDEAYWNDLNTISSRVERITGQKSMFIRFPGGSSNTVSRHYSSGIMSRLVNDVESKGYSYFDWNVDSRDAETVTKTSDQVYSNVTKQLSKSHGNVILMHDIKQTTAGAIERIIQYGQNNGYTFKVLDSGVVCHHKTAN